MIAGVEYTTFCWNAQIVIGPLITEGVCGIPFTLNDLAPPATPQMLIEYTEIIPVVNPELNCTVQVVPFDAPTIFAPAGTTHRYEAAPETAAILYVTVVSHKPAIGPVILPGTRVIGIFVFNDACEFPQAKYAITLIVPPLYEFEKSMYAEVSF